MDLLSRWEKEGTMVFYSSALYDTGSEYLISSLSYDRIAETAVNVSLSLRDADIANLQFLTDPNGVEINKSPSNVSKPPIQKGKVVKKNVTDVATNRAISVHNNRTGGPSVIPSSTGTRGRVG